MAVTIGQHLRRNTRSSMAAFVTQQVLKFFLVPFVYAALQEGYALTSIAFVFFGYFAIYNFGIDTAYVKYTAECHASGDYDRLSKLLSTGTALCGVLGMATLLILFLFLDPITAFFDVEPAYYDSARFVIAYIGVVAMLNVVLGAYRAALSGIQRLDIANYTRAVFAVVEFIAVLVLLRCGYGVRAVVAVFGATIVGPLVVMVFLLRRHLPQVHVNPFKVRRDALQPLFVLGGRMQILGILTMFVVGFDRLVLFRYEAITFTTAYMIARNLAFRVQAVCLQGLGPLIPASAALHTDSDRDKAVRVFSSALRLIAVASAYFLVFTALNSDLIVKAYVDPKEYSAAASMALMVLSLAAIVHTCTGPGSSMLRGAGKPLLESVFHLSTLICFGVFFAIAKHAGDERFILLSFPLALASSSVIFIILSNRHFGVSLLCPLNAVFLPVAAAFACGALLRIAWNLLPISASPTRLTAAAAVLAMGFLYTALFAPCAWFLPGLTPVDKDQLVRFIPYGRRILRLLGLPEPRKS